jgi:dipeptidyl aminopeptidase/acylaminoacyl peptidase
MWPMPAAARLQALQYHAPSTNSSIRKMTPPTIAPYGAWSSPLTAAKLAAASLSLSSASAHAGRLYWVESRPLEAGRNVLVALGADGEPIDVTPPEFNVRTRVHESGGRAHVHVGDRLVYSHYADQRLYMQREGRAPTPVTPAGFRYADGAASLDGRRLYCVREDHSGSGEPRNTIVVLDPDAPSAGQVLFAQSDFVAAPQPSPDGRQLAFISWNHPQMPWDGTTLQVGELAEQTLHGLQAVAGGTQESVLEPRWAGDGSLYFLSDRSGFWNLYRWRNGTIEAITTLDADLGGPLWQLGQATYTLTGDGQALVRVCHHAIDRLLLVDLASRHITPLDLPFVAFGSLGIVDAHTAHAIAMPVDDVAALITIDLPSGRHRTVRRAAQTPPLETADISRAEPIEFPTAPAPDGTARSAHAFFFPPHNSRFAAPVCEKPPLIVLLHGGPTAHRAPDLRLDTQYWTTRGFAVVDVNYGGSTGFGRAYRERLRGQWGVVDLADAVGAVDFLAAAGRIDPERVAIRGGSAGGFTVLSALAFTDRFAAGINYYGVVDLEMLAADTHKFESRYLDGLVAPLSDETRALYRARSPIHHLQRLDAALITFQGLEDVVVPPSQSRAIVEAVRARGRPVAYVEFDGEQHGLRRSQNIVRALEAELCFLGQVFGFEPAERIAPVTIDNLDRRR